MANKVRNKCFRHVLTQEQSLRDKCAPSSGIFKLCHFAQILGKEHCLPSKVTGLPRGQSPFLTMLPPRLYHMGRGVIPQRRSESFMEGRGDSLKSCDFPGGPVSKTQAPPTQGAQAPSLVREVDSICCPKTWHRQIHK